jgi:hypothetical protein
MTDSEDSADRRRSQVGSPTACRGVDDLAIADGLGALADDGSEDRLPTRSFGEQKLFTS